VSATASLLATSDAPQYRPPSERRRTESSPRGSTHFIHLSFEGPDRYSWAGGLAARVTSLTQTLASLGHQVDLYFVGDPDLPAVEVEAGVVLHRWCQPISATAPKGVYDADERKLEDLCLWLPEHLATTIADDIRRGIRPIVLAEDWHMAWPLIGLHDELTARGLRDQVELAWTANNRFGFERIDFVRLEGAATILTISRAMKHLMWQYGVNPRVVPNGLDESWTTPLTPAPGHLVELLAGRMMLAKVGRWDLDKRWVMAIDAVAELAAKKRPAVLIARGWDGSAAGGAHVLELRKHAAERGLAWVTVTDGPRLADGDVDLVAALAKQVLPQNAIVELAFAVRGEQLRSLYREADAVLANSGFEPFGLVGLEAMATSSIVITGSTGEDYVRPFRNGFALDTDRASEIVGCLDWLYAEPGRASTMREAARCTAQEYRWVDIVERLLLALGLS
jgi:glycosyltransferase involved in cell wall biosynthesis